MYSGSQPFGRLVIRPLFWRKKAQSFIFLFKIPVTTTGFLSPQVIELTRSTVIEWLKPQDPSFFTLHLAKLVLNLCVSLGTVLSSTLASITELQKPTDKVVVAACNYIYPFLWRVEKATTNKGHVHALKFVVIGKDCFEKWKCSCFCK